MPAWNGNVTEKSMKRHEWSSYFLIIIVKIQWYVANLTVTLKVLTRQK